MQGWEELIELLVRELKSKVDAQDSYQFTPLHAAANGGHVPTIHRLIQYQHDVDMHDYLGALQSLLLRPGRGIRRCTPLLASCDDGADG